MSDLAQAVNTVVRRCLAVREGEQVVVVVDPRTAVIGEALREEAVAAGADGVLMIMEERAADGESTKLIYFICDEKDRKASVPVRRLCKQLGYEVALPAFEGDASQVRKTNQQLLASCDSVFVFYGAGDEAWKRTIDSELKKMAGYRGGKPLTARCIYLAEPRTSDKEDLIDMEEPGLINGLGGFEETAIAKSIQAAIGAEATS